MPDLSNYKPVIVYVSGGLVQHVHNPSNRDVEIIDYDVTDDSACDCREAWIIDVDRDHYHNGFGRHYTGRHVRTAPSLKWVHQFLTPTGWDTSTDDDGTPSTFDTEAEAEAELEIFHDEVAAAVSRGDMDDHNRADWRVAELEG